MSPVYIGLRMAARYPSGAWVHVDAGMCGVHVRSLALGLSLRSIWERRA